MKKILFIVFVVFVAGYNFAQTEDESCNKPNKKTEKYIEAAKRSSNVEEVITNFTAAIKQSPENAEVHFQFGLFFYRYAMSLYKEREGDPSKGDKALNSCKEMLEKTLELCPDYHADCYYYLGAIAYNFGNKELAEDYFQKFIDFKSDDTNRYPNDYTKKLADVKQVMVKEENKKQDFKNMPVPFNPQLVQHVSSKADEYFPMLSPDNDLIFYTRKVDRTKKGDLKRNIVEEFTYSERKNYLGQFDDGTPFSYPFNDGTFQSYGAATMSIDNKEMILCACKDEQISGQTYRNCDLYLTHFERTGDGGNDYQWTPLENMGLGINSPSGWDAQPSLSADGNTLYYTTLRAGRDATQDNDIWVAHRNEDGSWGKGVPFTEINTKGKDKSPFLHQDSETLYFVSSVSDERPGVGGLDIYYIRKENGKWTKPKNIGFPINTSEDEIGLFVSLDGKTAYYSSKQNGNWDIYSFDLYPEARPKPVKIIKGELNDSLGNPIENAQVEIIYSDSNDKKTFKVNGTDGKYAAIVKIDKPQDVIVTLKKEGAAFDSKLITKEEISEDKDPVIRNENMEVKELKEGDAYTINDILFATNSYILTERAKFIVKQFANFLHSHPSMEIIIQGHTDDVGNDHDNLILSDNRANAVKQYLTQLGIESKRLESKGFGETHPKVPNVNEENRAINRRTEFMIKKM